MDQTTETIMREFREYVQRMIDHVATLSTQAQQVDGLREQVTNLFNRVGQLESENAELRRDLDGTTNRLNEVQSMLHSTQNQLDVERGVTQSLRDTIVQRDNAVVELNTKVEHETSDHRVTKADLEDARRKIEEQSAYIDRTNQALQDMTDGRDHWQGEAIKLQAAFNELKTKHDRITSILNPPQPVSSDVQSA